MTPGSQSPKPAARRDAHEAKWAERDARKAFHEKVMADQAASERARLIEVIEQRLDENCSPGAPWLEVAEEALWALIDDGVVFAYIGAIENEPADNQPVNGGGS